VLVFLNFRSKSLLLPCKLFLWWGGPKVTQFTEKQYLPARQGHRNPTVFFVDFLRTDQQTDRPTT